jgi:predicted transcriptional regulator
MDRLYKKGWLRRKLVGTAHVYEPVASRESYTAELMRDALATSGNQAAAFVHSYPTCHKPRPRAALKIEPQGNEA